LTTPNWLRLIGRPSPRVWRGSPQAVFDEVVEVNLN
jgi:hypothetical protein